MSTDNTKQVVYQRVMNALSKRVQDSIPELAESDLAQLSMAGILNLLFLLRGEWGSLGDFVSTQKALRALVGETMFWGSPQDQPHVPQAVVH
jgi:hypothetical protein